MRYFKLPFAGDRDTDTAKIYDQGVNGSYWTSSPTTSHNVWGLFLDSSEVSPGKNRSRTRGYSVRCFKDSYVAPTTYTLTFNSQGGSSVASQIAVEGETRSRPANPTKTNSIFVNWYTSTSYATLFDFSAPASQNKTAYAKWNEKAEPTHNVGGNSLTYNGSAQTL